MNHRIDPNQVRGKVIVVSGPSGVGKSTICREVVKRRNDLDVSTSVTTRKPGPGEQDGRDYWFVSESEFRRRIEEGLLLEYAEVFGNLYGTPKDKVDEILATGRNVILEIDVQGGRQAKAVYPDAVMVFILPPDEESVCPSGSRAAVVIAPRWPRSDSTAPVTKLPRHGKITTIWSSMKIWNRRSVK